MSDENKNNETEIIADEPPSAANQIAERFAKHMEGIAPAQFNKPPEIVPDPADAGKAPPAKAGEKPPEKAAEKPGEAKPAEPAKATEPKPVLDDAPPGNVVGKAAESWNSFKAKANKEISARETKIVELTKALEAAQKSAQPVKIEEAPAYVELRKKFDDMEAQMKIVAVERHPDFIKYFSERTKSAVDAAKAIVGAELAPKLEKILSIGDSETRSEQLEALASELSAFKQGELATAIGKLRDVEAEKAAEIAKAGKSFETLQAKNRSEQEQSVAKKKAATEKAKADALAVARTFDSFKPKEGDEAHNALVKQNEELVNAFFDGKIDPKLFPSIPALAAEAMYLRDTKIPALESEIKKRDELLKQYQAAGPKLEHGGAKPPSGDTAPTGGKFVAAFQSNWPAQK